MVQIITDTTACLPLEIVQKLNIPVIPQIINFGNESFREGLDISTEEFMERLIRATELPKTAAPPPELFVEVFSRLVPLGEPILCIHPSSEVSGTIRSATVAAMEFPDADIRIIDTKVVASPVGSMVLRAAEFARQGMDADDICSYIEDRMRRCKVYFMVATLDYLVKGGRIGGAQALLGSLLQIKPILTLRDGRVDQFERDRTHKRALAHLKQLVLDEIDRTGEGDLSIMHADVAEEAQEIATELKEKLGLDDIWVTNVPPAIVTHGGPGILGVGFFAKR